jgi:hypothetical protein
MQVYRVEDRGCLIDRRSHLESSVRDINGKGKPAVVHSDRRIIGKAIELGNNFGMKPGNRGVNGCLWGMSCDFKHSKNEGGKAEVAGSRFTPWEYGVVVCVSYDF